MIAVDEQEDVSVIGRSYGSGTEEDYATIKYVQISGISEEEKIKEKDYFLLLISLNHRQQ